MHQKINRGFGVSCLFFLILPSLFFSCAQPAARPAVPEDKQEHTDSVHHKPASGFRDTLLVDFRAAVFFKPDSLQNQQIKAITDPKVFESIEHECFFQMRYSRMTLKAHWPDVRIIEARNIRYILFRQQDGKTECIDLDSQNDPCGVLIFNGKKKALLVDMTNIDTELGFYF